MMMMMTRRRLSLLVHQSQARSRGNEGMEVLQRCPGEDAVVGRRGWKEGRGDEGEAPPDSSRSRRLYRFCILCIRSSWFVKVN